jgi:rare lipoprotein A
MLKIRFALLVILFILSLLPACLKGMPEPEPGEFEPSEYSGKHQEGLASWYGGKFHGRATASGEIYDMDDMTAAHKTAPLGTWAYVTNLENQRSVLVKINDRGPFVRGRIIDLSRAAARTLEMQEKGIARVRVKFLGMRTPEEARTGSGSLFTVQFGAFVDQEKAAALKNRLRPYFPDVYIKSFSLEGTTFYRVRTGKLESRHEAEKAAKKVKRAGYPCTIMPY